MHLIMMNKQTQLKWHSYLLNLIPISLRFSIKHSHLKFYIIIRHRQRHNIQYIYISHSLKAMIANLPKLETFKNREQMFIETNVIWKYKIKYSITRKNCSGVLFSAFAHSPSYEVFLHNLILFIYIPVRILRIILITPIKMAHKL